ncbi:carbohydrate kinase family protein [Halorarum salinum]|uniref:carbohydrate kinase family protein n=1 Tax=Halorarum salinum TaxID=2743089 RepID=UPI001FE3EBB1|nr:carbohydrate kinase family protein [Halobaculum salinum]
MTPEVVTIGAATVDRQYLVSNHPEPDGGAFANDVEESFGGVAANVATACARFGREAGLVARLGEDDVADRVLEELRRSALDVSRVRREPGTSTHCVILRDGDGRRSIVTAGDSTKRLRLDDADLAYLADADAMFVTAYAPDPVHEALLSRAREDAFPPVAFDLSGRPAELEGRGARVATVDAWVEAASLFVVGEVAAEAYLGCSGREAAERLRERGADGVASTVGDDGATLLGPEADLDVPALDVDVVDETGAGDAFVAGLIDAWVLGDASAADAGRFAAAAAGLNCESAGARGGLPTREEVEAALAAR